jgi:hypothetical protein
MCSVEKLFEMIVIFPFIFFWHAAGGEAAWTFVSSCIRNKWDVPILKGQHWTTVAFVSAKFYCPECASHSTELFSWVS